MLVASKAHVVCAASVLCLIVIDRLDDVRVKTCDAVTDGLVALEDDAVLHQPLCVENYFRF